MALIWAAMIVVAASGLMIGAMLLAWLQQFQTAQLLPLDARADLAGELVCYGRSVVATEWPAMESGAGTDDINPWGFELFRTFQGIEPEAASEQLAYEAWLTETDARVAARRDRLHASEGVVPMAVWSVLFLSAGLILVYLLFFADSAEPAVVQGLMAGSVTAVIVATLLMLGAPDRPYQDIGGIRPVAMERTLSILDEARDDIGMDDPLPCDEAGRQI